MEIIPKDCKLAEIWYWTNVIAIIEFKYKNKYGYEKIESDFHKIKKYQTVEDLTNTKYYVASIYNCDVDKEYFLDRRAKWAKNITQLNAFKENDDEMKFCIYDSIGEIKI